MGQSVPIRTRAALGRMRSAVKGVRRAQPDGAPLALPGREPLSRAFGADRGRPIDRWYIERFLGHHRDDVRGRVLEVAERTYTHWYGDGAVTSSDVLYAADGLPDATVVGDLTTGDGLPSGAFDCFICTQTLQLIYDVGAAVKGTHDVLAPGGVLLCTVPALSQTSRVDRDRWGDWWRFTAASARRLLGEVYGAANVTVTAHGNALVAASFLYGLAAEELDPADLEDDDDEYELLITARAVRER
ncbi:MAG TPA: methyltransferase domain-containing protein [Solirubrobacteraceae bacterium]|nr:methyltransferase domain-containing protein [Solirubrobacteraceae bacterium]